MFVIYSECQRQVWHIRQSTMPNQPLHSQHLSARRPVNLYLILTIAVAAVAGREHFSEILSNFLAILGCECLLYDSFCADI